MDDDFEAAFEDELEALQDMDEGALAVKLRNTCIIAHL